MANYECDLHTHSVRSDGNDTVIELIDNACTLGMKAIALTDHDVRPPKTIEADGAEVSPAAYALSRGLIFIPGIEFSCDTYVDDVHIVGLGCDFEGPAMLEIEREMAKSKVNGYRELVRVLNEDGMALTWEEVLSGRPEEEAQRKHVFEAIARKGYAKSWNEAKLMVRDNPRYNIRREKVDPARAIAAILEAGGIAVLAHPYLIDERVPLGGQEVSRAQYIENLIAHGLQGIEAAYTYGKTSYKGGKTAAEIEMEVRRDYEGRLPLISGGSDYHADGKKGVANARAIGEAGVTWAYFSTNPLLKRFVL